MHWSIAPSRRLFGTTWVTVAAPTYIERFGRPVQVLPDESTEGPVVWMLWVDGAAPNARVRAFTEFFSSSS